VGKKSVKGVKRGKQLGKSERLEILELRAEHKWARGKIAKKYGRSVRTIDRVLTKAIKVQSLNRGGKLGKEEKSEIKRIIRENEPITCRALARNPALKRVKVATVRRYLKRKGYVCIVHGRKPVWQELANK
jgi:Homeodomain-like domain